MTTDAAPGIETAPRQRRPVLVTISIVLVYISGVGNTVLGVLVLLSRYDVQGDDAILTTSLLGAGIILLGLLTIAGASSLSRGSRLARILITLYFGIQTVLHILTIVDSDTWDVSTTIQIMLELFAIVVLWLPPGSRYFDAAADDPVRPAAS